MPGTPANPTTTTDRIESRPAPVPDASAASARSSPSGLMHGYAPPAGVCDELIDSAAPALPRPHWMPYLHRLSAIGADGVRSRWEQAQRLIHENGVTYNVYGDPRGMDRPWQLDPIPLVLPEDHWRSVEAGLLQRATLLDLLAADLHGPQKLLHDKALPPELVFAHGGFLRACHGIRVPGGRYLHLYAADLGRGPTGETWVLADRTQAPSGSGYALENRLVVSRTFPEVFRECRVHRLALFFQSLRKTLASLAPRNRDNPRIVLLTPGPYNETYFEHAYLARYLGYQLVEGGDLTVRDDRVYLKTLAGLQPVDVVLRRLDDDYCDPLELRPGSMLGVPGLVQAVRAGHVAVSNALGTGLVESPAIMPFLPGLCRRLLSQDLLLPSVNTWWLGQPRELRYAIEHLDRLVIKPAFAGVRQEAVFGQRLAGPEREKLIARLRARPYDYVAQQQVALSTAPVLTERGPEPRHVVLRAFLTADDDRYRLMPGGLTRVSASTDSLVVSMQRGGGSKDTWVLSSGPVSSFSLLRGPEHPVELSRSGHDLPSRLADNLYWLGRYAERAEGLIRLTRTILSRLDDAVAAEPSPELQTLLRALTHVSLAYPGFTDPEAPDRLLHPDAELLSIISDPRRDHSIAAVLASVRRVASVVRDRLSGDAWRVISALPDQPLPARPAAPASDEPPTLIVPALALESLHRVVNLLMALGGQVSESMSRSYGWRFLDAGRRVERAVQTIALLRATLLRPAKDEGPLLEALLETADSAITYRRRYLANLHAAGVLDLLLSDETNPRSLAYQLASLADHADRLPADHLRAGRRPDQLIILAALTSVRLADIDRLSRPGPTGLRDQLDDLLDRLFVELPAFSDALSQAYLVHAVASTRLDALPITAPPRTAV